MIYEMKMSILAIFGHFWPVFGLLWPPDQFLTLSISIFDLVLTGLGEVSEKILINNDLFDKNADFGHFGPFLACFWPVTVLVWPPNSRKLCIHSSSCQVKLKIATG